MRTKHSIFAKYVFIHLFQMQHHPWCFFSTASFSAVGNQIYICVCVRQWFRDVCHFVRNSFSFCSQSCWECSTWSYQCLDWYTVTAASLLKEKCTHGLCRFPIFYQHFFLTGFFRQSQSLLAHLGYYLKLQIITYHCMIHACLMVCTCKPDITRLSLDYYSTYFAIVVGYALIHYVKACVLLVSQFHSNLPNDYQRFLTWLWHVAFYCPWWSIFCFVAGAGYQRTPREPSDPTTCRAYISLVISSFQS